MSFKQVEIQDIHVCCSCTILSFLSCTWNETLAKFYCKKTFHEYHFCITGYQNDFKMVKSLHITTLILLAISLFAVVIASPLFDKDQEKILDAILERVSGADMTSFGGDEIELSKYTVDTARETNDKTSLRDSPKKRVGDRRLKCVLYDAKNKKCLRHKMNFLWGRR